MSPCSDLYTRCIDTVNSYRSSSPSLSWSDRSQIFPSIDTGSLEPIITFRTLSPGSRPFSGRSWSNKVSYFLFSSGFTRKLMLGAGVPLGAAATLAPGAVLSPK